MLARYLGEEPQRIGLELGERGKPRLASAAPLRFNLSHSGELALIAVSGERDVGIDLEWIRPRRQLVRLAERGIGPAAAEALRAAPAARRPALFHEAWVRHEAMVKCLGGGLAAPLPETPLSVFPIEIDGGWAAALAVAGDPPPLRRLLLPAP